MFLLTEVKYRLFRTPGRTTLLLLTAAFLVATIGGYLATIKKAKSALDSLAENIPVTLKVVSRNGNRDDQLLIDTAHFDAIVGVGVHNVHATTTYAGAYSSEAMAIPVEEFYGGDVSIRGGNGITTLNLENESVDYLPGYDGDVFSGNEAVCLASKSFATENDISQGEIIPVKLYSTVQTDRGVIYTYVGKNNLKVIGLAADSSSDDIPVFDVYVPINWLREITSDAGLNFYYESLSAEVDDPFRLNEIKDELEKKAFLEVFETAGDIVSGDALSIEDETFVKTSVELTKNIETYEAFLLPTSLLMTGIIIFIAFLVLRSSRRELAIASSLGRRKMPNAASHFLGAVISEFAGCILMAPVICLGFDIGLGLVAIIIAIFMFCASIGTAVALALILRFDTMELLTKVG